MECPEVETSGCQGAEVLSVIVDPAIGLSTTLRSLTIFWVEPGDLPTVTGMGNLEKLSVVFAPGWRSDDDPEPYLAARPVANLKYLPRLSEINLSTGHRWHCILGRINCTFVGVSHSVRTFVLDADIPPGQRPDHGWDLYDHLGPQPLPRLMQRFPKLCSLCMSSVGGQQLIGVELPFLRTLESHWCSTGTVAGMVLPSLQSLSFASTIAPDRPPLQDVLPYMDTLHAAHLCLELDLADEDAIYDLSDFYSLYRARWASRLVCLVEGDVRAPPVGLENMGYLKSVRLGEICREVEQDDYESMLQHKERRQERLRALGLDRQFHEFGCQEYGQEWYLDEDGFRESDYLRDSTCFLYISGLHTS